MAKKLTIEERWINVLNGFNCTGKMYPTKELAEQYCPEGYITIKIKQVED